MDDGIRLRSQDYARRKVDDIFNDSDLEDRSHKFSKFQMSELVLGKELGRGAFGKACEIVAFKLPTLQSNEGNLQEASTLTLGHEDSRHFLARHCLREKGGSTGGHARYAMKQLLPSVVANTAMFIKGIADMAIETRLLSTLEHPNLIKLRATAACDPFQPEYFLIMDRLYDTLGDRLKTWEKQLKKFTGFSAKLTDRTGEKAANLYAERILAVFDLASAMEHLHGCRIVYRDLKPENIGFDVRNDLKLFDFGLAKWLAPAMENDDGTYNLTGFTGSPLYVSPENANSAPYNQSCDVYSISILLWQVLSCKTPYEMYTPKSLREKVYNGPHKRPLIDTSWREPIKTLLQDGWQADLHKRSTMSHIRAKLGDELLECGSSDADHEHVKSRNAFGIRDKNHITNLSSGGLSDITDKDG